MPHITSFFRSSHDPINTIKATVRRRSPSSRTPVSATPRPGSTRTVSYPNSVNDEAEEQENQQTRSNSSQSVAPPVRMPESAREKEVSHHRLSFPGLHLGGHKSKDHGHQHPHASLDWKIESPPAVMYGDAENSTGAIVSGQLMLTAKDAPLEVEGFKARLEIHVIRKRPYKDHCHDCANQKTELKTWELIAGPATLSQGVHYYPFSALLEGHLPASTDNSVVTVRYDFTAEAKPKNGSALKLLKTINVRRALPVPETPHHSVRIFPPTNITASVHYPNVIHPIGSNKLELRLEGIIKSNPDVKTIEYWKLKRLSWKIEEHLTTVVPACQKHSPKDPETGEPTKKGLKRTEARTIGSGDLASGWKADYSPNGNVEMELEYQVNPSLKPVCDLKSNDGTEVTHQLVIEMVVAQEYAPTNQPKHVTPTGVARILRMHFGTIVTERSGLGVSWDNEAPPIYQDVPPSPPSYHCEIPYEEVDEALSPLDAPSKRSN